MTSNAEVVSDTPTSSVLTLSPETISILKNFALVYKGIAFKPGSQLRTISELSNIYAEADIKETIQREFAIYDLNIWLGTIGLFKEPSFTLHDRYMNIRDKDGKSTVTYYYAGSGMVKTPPDRKIVLPTRHIKFSLSDENISTLKSAASLFDIKDLVMESDGTSLRVGAESKKEKQANNYFLNIDGSPDGIQCKMVLKIENMRLLKGSYDVCLAPGVINFNHLSANVRYFIAAEVGSRFTEK